MTKQEMIKELVNEWVNYTNNLKFNYRENSRWAVENHINNNRSKKEIYFIYGLHKYGGLHIDAAIRKLHS